MTEVTREDIISMLSDMSKDAYGFRMRTDYSAYTMEQLEEEVAFLQVQVDASIEADKQNEAAAVLRFEAYISEMMKDHGVDRATAIRWDMEAENADDSDFYCYLKGLPYSYENSLTDS